jgi:type VI protein secretion system component VasF
MDAYGVRPAHARTHPRSPDRLAVGTREDQPRPLSRAELLRRKARAKREALWECAAMGAALVVVLVLAWMLYAVVER